MPRKSRKNPVVGGGDVAFAAGIAAAMRPMIEQIVDQRIAERVREFLEMISPRPAVGDEPTAGDESKSAKPKQLTPAVNGKS